MDRRRPVLIGTLATLALLAASARAEVPQPQQISFDPFTDTSGQHETAVEPDSFSFGNTVVAAFQVGRIASGGASGIGWATSTNGGMTWTKGVLPRLTQHGSPPGPLTAASDPAVAYDQVHGAWLVSILGLRDGRSGLASSLLVSRSPDGLVWSAPVVTSGEPGFFGHDKNWIVCDNGARSAYRGRCYVVWTAVAESDALLVAPSDDGGATWGTPTVAESASGSAWQPLVRPDGTLVVVYVGEGGIRAVRSSDGGRTFSRSVRVASRPTASTPGMRAPSLPSAEVDAAGRISAAWHDCRYRSRCRSNDIVLSSSADGVRWTRPRRVPTGAALDGLQHVVPGLAVDRATRGARGRLALTFYALAPRGCEGNACAVAPRLVSSRDGGRSWSAPQPLMSALPLSAYPQASGGRFLGDYISTSFVSGGVAVPVFAAALGPSDGGYHQGVFATAVTPLPAAARPLTVGPIRSEPRPPRATRSLTVSATVLPTARAAQIACTAAVGDARLRAQRSAVVGGRAICAWRLPSSSAGRRVSGSIAVATPEADARRAFSFRVR